LNFEVNGSNVGLECFKTLLKIYFFAYPTPRSSILDHTTYKSRT